MTRSRTGGDADDGVLVYSTERGPLPRRPRRAAEAPRRPAGDGIVRVRREVKGRRGKTVTTLEGLALGEAELRSLAKELKRLCGSGGSLKDGVIEVQGDHRDRLVAELEARGYTAKRAGG